jgi:hypothetical protein
VVVPIASVGDLEGSSRSSDRLMQWWHMCPSILSLEGLSLSTPAMPLSTLLLSGEIYLSDSVDFESDLGIDLV